MAKKYKKIWNSKAEYDAHNAQVEQRLRRFRALLEKAQAEIDAKRQEQGA